MQRRAWRAERLGTEMRKRNSTDQTNRLTLIASFDSHCIFTPTQLSAEERSCITAKQCPCFWCWTSTRRRRGLTCARMSGRRAPWRICTRRATARHAACTPCEAAFIARLPFLGGVFGNARETESESTRWRDSFDHRVFVTDSGGHEAKMKHIARDASTPSLFLLLFALPCLLH